MSFAEGHVYQWGVPFATRVLGPQRAEGIDNAHEAIHRNLVRTMNSDYATADIEPLRYIQTALTRLPIGATGPLGHDLRVGVEQACRLDDRFGSIETGNDADLVEIGADPMTFAPSTIAAIQATWLRGMRFARA